MADLPEDAGNLFQTIDSQLQSTTIKKPRRIAEGECSTCSETMLLRDMTSLKCCQTRYCKDCFRSWFEAALAGKQLPKCCHIGIEPDDYKKWLPAPIKRKYRAVVKEMEAERKVWCSNEECRATIKIDQDASGFVACKKCRRKTCASCNLGVAAHKGRNKACANYVSDKTLNDAIASNKWKRCPGCYVPVEKILGCNDVECLCGTTFCFRCGVSKRREGDPCGPSQTNRDITEDPIEPEANSATALPAGRVEIDEVYGRDLPATEPVRLTGSPSSPAFSPDPPTYNATSPPSSTSPVLPPSRVLRRRHPVNRRVVRTGSTAALSSRAGRVVPNQRQV